MASIDRINFNYGYVEIESVSQGQNIEYYGKIIPLPKGTIYLTILPDTKQIFEVLFDFFDEIGIADYIVVQDYVDWLIKYLNINIHTAEFYTEVANPESLNYVIKIAFVDEVEKEYIENWISELFENIKEGIRRGKFPERLIRNFRNFVKNKTNYSNLINNLYDTVNSYVNELNRYIYAGGRVIQIYIKKLQDELESARYERD